MAVSLNQDVHSLLITIINLPIIRLLRSAPAAESDAVPIKAPTAACLQERTQSSS